MMREVGRISAGVARSGRSAGRGAAGFAVGLPEAAAAGQAGAAAPAAAVGLGLLAVQEGGDRAARDHSARRRAESILQELQGLQRELLHDGADMKRLERLAALDAGVEAEDPLLRSAVEAIVLRARVELARRGWNGAVSTP